MSPDSTVFPADLVAALIKAYDVRGLVDEQLTPQFVTAVGAAFVESLGLREAGAVVVGHDMRPSSPAFARAFAEGATAHGVDVILIGLCSTDGLYFASGTLDLPGAMFTASHNPAAYNGIKLCLAGAAPVGQDTGLREISRMLVEGVPEYSGRVGHISEREMLADYADYLISLVPPLQRPLRVVVDAGNGMAGLTAPVVLGKLPVTVEELYFELDGSFPNHEANPIDPANLVDLQAAVKSSGADLGLAFDGDADRCFVVDERGELVNPSTLTALIATQELARVPGAAVIHNLITSRAVPEIISENDGVPVVTRVGHSFIKATMAQTGAVFGGEHSGHFYFRDFWRADSGMLAALHVLSSLAATPAGTTLSQVLVPYSRYVLSGEINTEVSDQQAAIAAVREHFADRDVTFSDLDGLTVDGGTWWVNVRPSNTEPLLRLNVEAPTEDQMASLRDEVLALYR
ncbi:MAG: phosphomannomutase/phosphoglucomutase [Actinobacteria bacterium]|nr:phosphomannomutase/phosphoglucomutase [Actinomycetota bacterium]MCB8996385.1 phosphomannomutase/phosphoglucomutase [Actinomycetota bacterium]MCB9414904.1 phosphomannomutase/phosphoglucomutase [Actinomycetota bacterium]HRY09811.1 phosphomannomutase/phosphoglucomutase [Candidatus Nanopelagicales bacterium]